MKTIEDTRPQPQPDPPPELIPPVCLKTFERFAMPLWRTRGDLQANDNLTEDVRDAAFLAIATEVALRITPETPQAGKTAAALVYRLLSLLTSIDRGDLQTIGERYFGHREELLRRRGPDDMEIKGVAILAAAFADLLSGDDGFRVDCLAAAILMLPAGCPLPESDDCPPEFRDCGGQD